MNFTDNILIGSAAGFIVFVLSAILTHYTRKYWFIQPKLIVRNREQGAKSGGLDNSRLKLEWKGKLEIYNSTKHDALNVEFIWPNNRPTVPLSPLSESHVKALDTVSVSYVVERIVPKESVARATDRFKECLPEELRSFALVLRYTNEMNKSFYTRYAKDEMGESCTFHRHVPVAT